MDSTAYIHVASTLILHLTRGFYMDSTAYIHVASTWIIHLTRGFYLDSTAYTWVLPGFYSLHTRGFYLDYTSYTWLLPGFYSLHVASTWIIQLTRGFYLDSTAYTWLLQYLDELPWCSLSYPLLYQDLLSTWNTPPYWIPLQLWLHQLLTCLVRKKTLKSKNPSKV